MKDLYAMAQGANARFPEGNTPFQIVTRLLEECGEVASEVNHWEGSGVKRLKHGEPLKEDLANEIRQAMVALTQLVLYYGLQDEFNLRIQASIQRSKKEGLID